MRCSADVYSHTNYIGRTEKSPGGLVIEKDTIMHQIVIGKIVTVYKFQRVEIKEVPPDTNGVHGDGLAGNR